MDTKQEMKLKEESLGEDQKHDQQVSGFDVTKVKSEEITVELFNESEERSSCDEQVPRIEQNQNTVEANFEIDQYSELFTTELENESQRMENNAKKSLKCLECDYEGFRNSDLRRHVLTHYCAKLFKCSDCSYECNRKEHLKIHMLEHS
ncbi:hypothetical protein Avbf_03307, partial [Armadillidium vulgare]